VLSTPQARGESPNGSKRSLASTCAAPATTTRSCPIRSVRFLLPRGHHFYILSDKMIISY
jgi:hypothetical protein